MSRVRPRSFQHVVASSNSSAAVRQQAGSLHPLVPRPDELVLGWLPASLLLMLQKFNALGVFSERLLLFLEVNTGFTSHRHVSLVLACSSICHLLWWHRLVHLCKHYRGCMVLLVSYPAG